MARWEVGERERHAASSHSSSRVKRLLIYMAGELVTTPRYPFEVWGYREGLGMSGAEIGLGLDMGRWRRRRRASDCTIMREIIFGGGRVVLGGRRGRGRCGEDVGGEGVVLRSGGGGNGGVDWGYIIFILIYFWDPARKPSQKAQPERHVRTTFINPKSSAIMKVRW